jgi:hypothetical protein
LLWWVQEKHVPAAVVAGLLAAGDFAITALEIPTGWLADRYGHRASLIAGSLAQVAGMLCCWLGQGTLGLLSAILLVAVGDAFRSGADQALLYRSCVALDCERDFQSIESRTRGLQLAALVAMILAGGAIVERWGFAIGWIAEAAMCAIGLALACAMIEPPACDADAPEDLDTPAAERATATTASARRPVPLAALFRLIAPAALLDGVAAGATFLAQTAGTSDPGAMSVLVAIITLAEAAGAALAARLPATMRSQVILAAAGAVIAGAAVARTSAFLPAVVALSFLTGVANPLRAAAIQRLAADHLRARAASIASACDRACTTVALLVAGALSRRR